MVAHVPNPLRTLVEEVLPLVHGFLGNTVLHFPKILWVGSHLWGTTDFFQGRRIKSRLLHQVREVSEKSLTVYLLTKVTLLQKIMTRESIYVAGFVAKQIILYGWSATIQFNVVHEKQAAKLWEIGIHKKTGSIPILKKHHCTQ